MRRDPVEVAPAAADGMDPSKEARDVMVTPDQENAATGQENVDSNDDEETIAAALN